MLAIVAALTLLPGCSWIFVEGLPPEHARRANASCTTSTVPQELDSLAAVALGSVGGVLTAVAASCDEPGYYCTGADTGVAIGVGLMISAGLFLASAVTGAISTKECRAAAVDRERVAAADRVAANAAVAEVRAPQRGANGTVEYTFDMSDVRVDLRAAVDNTERVHVSMSRIVAADRVSNTQCNTWSIVAGANNTSVPGGTYATTREAAGQRETFANNVPISALRQFVDGSNQGLAAIDLCRERLYLSMAVRNELARFFEELDAMVRERATPQSP